MKERLKFEAVAIDNGQALFRHLHQGEQLMPGNFREHVFPVVVVV